MSLWDLLYTLLDWIFSWRFNLCFWGSLFLAAIVGGAIPHEPLRWIVGGLILLSGMIVGYRWDSTYRS